MTNLPTDDMTHEVYLALLGAREKTLRIRADFDCVSQPGLPLYCGQSAAHLSRGLS